jgi:hypothetical protein
MRVIVRAVLLALTMGLFAVGGAQAAITTTAITSPNDPTFAYDSTDGAASATLTVTGTTDSTAPGTDEVDIDCYADDGSSGTVNTNGKLVSAVSLRSTGSFTATVPDLAIENAESSAPCRLRAVPTGTTPTTGLASFAGPRYALAYLELYPSNTSTAPMIDDYYVFAPQLGAADDYDSLGSCGLDDSYPYDATVVGKSDSEAFYCNDYLDTPGTEAAEVDGAVVLAPDDAKDTNTGFEPLTVSVTQNPANGDITISEVDPLMTCVGDPTCANEGTDSYGASGVQDTRTITQTDAGHVVGIHDVYSSTDGRSHSLSLNLENDERFGASSNEFGYEFPGQSSFTTISSAATEAVGSAVPASILIENNTDPAGSSDAPLGAVTYGTAPSSPFNFPSGGSTFYAPYTLSVPATGGVPLSFAYSTDTTQPGLASDVQVGDDLVDPPAVTFSSPAAGSTSAVTPVSVTGTATAGSGVKSLTVNGVTATVSGTTFTAAVPLVKGSSTLTATETSNSGATATATESVTYAPPAATVAATAKTGAASGITATSATVSGTATAGSAAGSTMFQYGTSKSYGSDTKAVAVAANAPAKIVTAKLSGLKAGTTYHYRLVVSGVAGADRTFTTKKNPRKLTLTVKPKSDAAAPYRYQASGKLTLPAGVTKKAGCKGTVTITVKHGKKVVATVRAKLTKACVYKGTASIKGRKLSGHGSLKLGASFGGNAALASKSAKARTVMFG